MAKIVHVIKNLDMGGTTKTCQLFCRYIKEYTDHDLFVLYGAYGDISRLNAFKEIIGRSDSDDRLLCFSGEKSCNNLIHVISPDIMHVYRAGQPEWPRPSCEYKFVETNVFGFYDPNHNIDKTLYMSKWLHDAAKKQLGIISRGISKWSTRFDYVNNPILPPDHYERRTLNDKAIWLGRCGRPDDGIYDDISVKATWLLRAKGYDIRFLVVAPPPRMIADMDQYDIPYEIIEPTVSESELSYFYNSIDIYAHARADGETFGNNIAEAMYHGKPVVTHVAVPSHPGMGVFQSQTTLVTDNVSGFIVNHSVPEYAQALECLIVNKELRESMGAAARDEGCNRFDWRISGHKLVKIYEELL